MFDNVGVYLFSSQAKDAYCLSPIIDALSKSFSSVSLVSFDAICDDMARFSVEECPVAVFSSMSAYDFAGFIRGGRPFISIGVEHGVAPFKGYSYNHRFLEYDCYISPTKMWADRMAHLHPRYAKKFTHFAYPRLDDLQARVERSRDLDHEAWSGAAPDQRDLVILSWGVDFSALRRMPDREGVVYLVHPSMFKAVRRTSLGRAKILVSDPDTAATLVAGAHRIFGDFSSMTLEAACLNPKTFMFVDRRFYGSDCDLKPTFFDHASAAFGRVESAGFSLPRAHVLNLESLAKALGGEDMPAAAAVRAWAPKTMMPEATRDQSEKAASVIVDVVSALRPEKRLLGTMSPSLIALKAVESAYHEVLGREPDYPAALTHAKNWLESPAAPAAKTISLYNTFAQSAEGKKRWAAGSFHLPQMTLAPMTDPIDEIVK